MVWPQMYIPHKASFAPKYKFMLLASSSASQVFGLTRTLLISADTNFLYSASRSTTPRSVLSALYIPSSTYDSNVHSHPDTHHVHLNFPPIQVSSLNPTHLLNWNLQLFISPRRSQITPLTTGNSQLKP